MANATFEFIRPFIGGGLGDSKIGILEFTGDYVTGGVDIGMPTLTPDFMFTDSGLKATIEGGKVILSVAGGIGEDGGLGEVTEVPGGTDVSGVKVFFVIKGGI